MKRRQDKKKANPIQWHIDESKRGDDEVLPHTLTETFSFSLFHQLCDLLLPSSFAHSLAQRRRFHSICHSSDHSLNCGVGFYFSPSLSLTCRPIVFNENRSHSIGLDTIYRR